MNTIDVYSRTTQSSGFKSELMKAFYEGVNKNNNPNWVAKLIDNYNLSDGTHAFCFNYQRDIIRDRVGLHLRSKVIDKYLSSGKIFFFDSNVLISYEKKKYHPAN